MFSIFNFQTWPKLKLKELGERLNFLPVQCVIPVSNMGCGMIMRPMINVGAGVPTARCQATTWVYATVWKIVIFVANGATTLIGVGSLVQ